LIVAIAVLVFLAACFSAISLLFGYSSRLEALQAVLPYREPAGASADLPQEMAKSLWERFLRPQLAAAIAALGRMMPSHLVESTERRLEQAGRPRGWSARGYLVVQGFLVIFTGALLLLLLRVHPVPARLSVVLLVAGPVAAFMVPNYLLDGRAAARRRAIQVALPDAIDILVVSVQAGLGLDGAIQELIARDHNPLTEELRRAQDELRAGRSREAAWHDMARRTGVAELTTFVSTVCQGERLGASIGYVLHTHAEAMRVRRSLLARELAAKIPVKMLFPMIFFIFPCLFVVMLGPGVIMMLHNFKSVLL